MELQRREHWQDLRHCVVLVRFDNWHVGAFLLRLFLLHEDALKEHDSRPNTHHCTATTTHVLCFFFSGNGTPGVRPGLQNLLKFFTSKYRLLIGCQRFNWQFFVLKCFQTKKNGVWIFTPLGFLRAQWQEWFGDASVATRALFLLLYHVDVYAYVTYVKRLISFLFSFVHTHDRVTIWFFST